MPAMTSVLVAICGTHLGDTKEAASMFGKPAAERRLTSSILTSAETDSFSFCRPSRGPTSTIFTFFGRVFILTSFVFGGSRGHGVRSRPGPHYKPFSSLVRGSLRLPLLRLFAWL